MSVAVGGVISVVIAESLCAFGEALIGFCFGKPLDAADWLPPSSRVGELLWVKKFLVAEKLGNQFFCFA